LYFAGCAFVTQRPLQTKAGRPVAHCGCDLACMRFQLRLAPWRQAQAWAIWVAMPL
jgi:hypothetical protein